MVCFVRCGSREGILLVSFVAGTYGMRATATMGGLRVLRRGYAYIGTRHGEDSVTRNVSAQGRHQCYSRVVRNTKHRRCCGMFLTCGCHLAGIMSDRSTSSTALEYLTCGTGHRHNRVDSEGSVHKQQISRGQYFYCRKPAVFATSGRIGFVDHSV